MADNIFPEFDNNYDCTIDMFSKRIQILEEGAILEFGAGSGESTLCLAKENPNRVVHTFDHFQGLEQTKQPTPVEARWIKGAFGLGHPLTHHSWPKNIEEFKEKIKNHQNISLNIGDVHQLKHPQEYNIKKIAAVNIDLDIYEPTVSAFRFIDQCVWNLLYIRFDDWHGNEPGFDFHERLACKEWLTKNNYPFSILENGSQSCVVVSR